MGESKTILELTGVTVESDPAYDSPVWNVSLRLGPGELALVRMERGAVRLPLADAAEGLTENYDGTATFLGRDWRSVPAGEGAALRGRISQSRPHVRTHQPVQKQPQCPPPSPPCH